MRDIFADQGMYIHRDYTHTHFQLKEEKTITEYSSA